MSTKSAAVDTYIENAKDFAKPILSKIRQAVHRGCPGVEEAIKWGAPYFLYEGMLCGMASFKKHVGFGFWRCNELDDPEGIFETGTGNKASMCSAHFHDIKELPNQRVLVDYVRRAKKLNEISKPKKKSKAKTETLKLPADLAQLLKKHRQAKLFFDSLAPSHRREYLEWIKEARRETTREKRLTTMVQWLSEKKRRNWKYEAKSKLK